jgi:hypothetical protein
MRARRLLGLFTMLVTFHLTLVGADAVCAEHGTPDGMSHHSASGTNASGGGMMVPAPEHGDSHRPCETTGSSHCCDAVTSCALTLALTAQGELSLASALGSISIAGGDTILLSRSLGPEPPPPKLQLSRLPS